MDLETKLLIDEFVLNDEDFNEKFPLVLEKLNNFLIEFLNKIIEKTNYTVGFNLNLIGDYSLNSNYMDYSSVNIMIEYNTKEDDYKYSETRANKGSITKLTSDVFNLNKTIVPTISELSKLLHDELTIKLKNSKTYLRKNCIALKLLNYSFFIFFVNSNFNKEDYNFVIKSKDYSLNFEKLTKNLLQKNEQTNGKFFNVIKFFKITELELMLIRKLKSKCSNILYFYENLLYNVPNELFDNDHIIDSFILVFSYLLNSNVYELKTADDKLLINDKYRLKVKPAITTIDIDNFFTNCKTFINNLDKILNG
ncbi:MAG: hypothetical protein E7359_01115 [Clostridiales bacterium]|nr:hypothetical protein [Clostridiales bacterium]